MSDGDAAKLYERTDPERWALVCSFAALIGVTPAEWMRHATGRSANVRCLARGEARPSDN